MNTSILCVYRNRNGFWMIVSVFGSQLTIRISQNAYNLLLQYSYGWLRCYRPWWGGCGYRGRFGPFVPGPFSPFGPGQLGEGSNNFDMDENFSGFEEDGMLDEFEENDSEVNN